MRITFGDQAVEIRPWGGEDSGKVLLMTMDPKIKSAALAQMAEFPDAFETLTDEQSNEDMKNLGMKDVMLIVAKTSKVGLFFDLKQMKPGFCVCEEADDEE